MKSASSTHNRGQAKAIKHTIEKGREEYKKSGNKCLLRANSTHYTM